MRISKRRRAALSPALEDSNVIRRYSGAAARCCRLCGKEAALASRFFESFVLGRAIRGFYAVHTLSICEDWRPVGLLSRSRSERRADDFAVARPTVLFADVRIAF